MSVADFRSIFPDQTTFADGIETLRRTGRRMVVVKGKVKSGKSLFPRYLSAIHLPVATTTTKIVNYFLSSYNRKSDRGQFADHEKYGLKVYPLYNVKQTNLCLDDIESDLAAGKIVILHIDELDYGSAWTGLLARIWRMIRNSPNVTCVLYSATPEEILKSDMWKGLPETQKALMNYVPVKEYCGDLTFLENGLVEDAEPAFTISTEGVATLGPQFKKILDEIKENVKKGDPRYIAVLRLCYGQPGSQESSN
jgi:hypothetical protein